MRKFQNIKHHNHLIIVVRLLSSSPFIEIEPKFERSEKMRLKEILEGYKKLVKLYEPVELIPAEEIEEGGIYWLPWKEPAFLAVIEKDKKFADVAPVSFCWPLATRRDFIVEIPHLISDTWIVQMDLLITTSLKVLKGAELIGKLSTEDLKILKDDANAVKPIPKNRRGMGYNDPIHDDFKDFEYRRYRRLLSYLLDEID
jgi:hypothetical protein